MERVYMKKFKSGYTFCITYNLGAYYVGRMYSRGNGNNLIYYLRKYKTLSGAEKYLLTKITYGKDKDDTESEVFSGTEKFIKEGSYLKLKENKNEC